MIGGTNIVKKTLSQCLHCEQNGVVLIVPNDVGDFELYFQFLSKIEPLR